MVRVKVFKMMVAYLSPLEEVNFLREANAIPASQAMGVISVQPRPEFNLKLLFFSPVTAINLLPSTDLGVLFPEFLFFVGLSCSISWQYRISIYLWLQK